MIHALLQQASRAGASDLHLTVGMPPFVRMHGEILIMNGPPLTVESCRAAIQALMTQEQVSVFERELQLCFSMTLPEAGYFRVTVYMQRGCMEAAIRVGIPQLRTPSELGLPPVLEEMVRRPHGLVLITGPTGSGKTTTLNALVDLVNRERRCKIVLMEDPIEYQHRNERSIVVQQEIGTDSHSFHRALVHVLRQDPDVIGVGEMRDLETISATLNAAETGHLVLATLHSNDCAQTVNRIVDVFPENQQHQVRYQLAASLRGIISQVLLPRADQPGRLLAFSLLVATPAVKNLIRENKLAQIPNAMVSGRNEGMISLDDMLRTYYQRAMISFDTAVTHLTEGGKLMAS